MNATGTGPILASSVLASLAAIVFIGSSSTLTPKGTYAMPDANGLRCVLENQPRPFLHAL